MALALTGAAGLFAACDPRPPDGLRRFRPDFYAHGFHVDGSAGKLYYLEGSYPSKTYLGVLDAQTAKARRWRYPGYALHSFAVHPGRSEAVLHALFVADDSHSSRLFGVDLRDGRKTWEARIPTGSQLSAMLLSPKLNALACILQSGDVAVLKMLGLDAHEFGPGKPLGRFSASAATLLDGGTQALLATGQDDGNRLILLDLEAGTTRQTELAGPLAGPLPLPGGGALAASRVPGEEFSAVVRLDPTTRRATELLRLPGEVESLAAVGDRFFAVAKDFTRPRDPQRRWLHPRTIAEFSLSRPAAPRISPWTSRGGGLLAVPNDSRHLYYCVQDGDDPAVWAVASEPEALARVPAAVDHKHGAWASAASYVSVQLIVVVVSGFLMALYYKAFWDFLKGMLT